MTLTRKLYSCHKVRWLFLYPRCKNALRHKQANSRDRMSTVTELSRTHEYNTKDVVLNNNTHYTV